MGTQRKHETAQLNPPTPGRVWMTVPEVAGYTHQSIMTVRRRIADGTYVAYKVGKGSGPRMLLLDRLEIDAAMEPVPVGVEVSRT